MLHHVCTAASEAKSVKLALGLLKEQEAMLSPTLRWFIEFLMSMTNSTDTLRF